MGPQADNSGWFFGEGGDLEEANGWVSKKRCNCRPMGAECLLDLVGSAVTEGKSESLWRGAKECRQLVEVRVFGDDGSIAPGAGDEPYRLVVGLVEAEQRDMAAIGCQIGETIYQLPREVLIK